jgi:5'(3')-deoxyribonucleotidase
MEKKEIMKEIVYFDMDGVLVDFDSGLGRLTENEREEYAGRLEDVPGVFARMDPMPGAIEAAKRIAEKFDVYVLSTAPWDNPSAWTDKLLWIKKHFGGKPVSLFYKRVVLSHHKDLSRGDYLIDDRTKKGAADFQGKHIHFGSDEFPDWDSVLEYLMERAAQAV